ncbi:hypothetical protein [Microcoleus sp. S36b_A2]|uniref:hypothetical protein n=1 Tax=Microcoleus sp. S36b_A2 TaxID=3055418 RepID=UPI002FD31D68
MTQFWAIATSSQGADIDCRQNFETPAGWRAIALLAVQNLVETRFLGRNSATPIQFA